MQLRRLILFVAAIAPITLFAQASPRTTHYRTVTVSCWSGGPFMACPGSSLNPADWSYSEFGVTAPWSTQCDFADPLPDDTTVVAASALVWSQYCGSDDVGDVTSFDARLDGEIADSPIYAHDEGFHCTCTHPTGSFGSFSGTNYVSGGTNTLQLTGGGGAANSVRIYHVDLTLAYTDASSPYYAVVGINTDPGLAYKVEKKVASGGAVTATVALGTSFSVGLIKKEPGQAGISTIVPLSSSYAVRTQDVEPALATEYNLFSDSVAVSLSGGVGQGLETDFIAVHLGTISLQVVPLTEQGVQPITVTVNVVPPAALGADHNEWDQRLIEAAHERGIPPQILKGQIRQESPNFRDSEWRYEPCSSDFAEISRGKTLINQEPYSLYAMDGILSDAGFADTADLRNSLYIFDPATGARRHLTHADTGVTARAIWDASNNYQGHGENWSSQTCSTLSRFIAAGKTLQDFLDTLDTFTAQTPTASSYGVMQAMYETALSYHWSVPDPASPGSQSQSPRYLRDTPEALQLKNGGSIFTGGTEDVQRYWDANQPDPTTFASQEDFFDSFKRPLRNYTGGGASQANYGVNIVDTYQYDYLPVQPGNIFP